MGQTINPHGPDVMVNSNVGEQPGVLADGETSMLIFDDASERVVCVAWMDFVFPGQQGAVVKTRKSVDGGSTFLGTSGLLVGPNPGSTGDPVLARNEVTGEIYLVALGGPERGPHLWKSTDCESFEHQGSIEPASPVTVDNDKPWIAVANVSDPVDHSRIYAVWSRNSGEQPDTGVFFAYLDDIGDGPQWTQTTLKQPAAAGKIETGHVVVSAPTGDLLVAGLEFSKNSFVANDPLEAAGRQDLIFYRLPNGSATWERSTINSAVVNGQPSVIPHYRPDDLSDSCMNGLRPSHPGSAQGSMPILAAPQMSVSPEPAAQFGYRIHLAYLRDPDATTSAIGPDRSSVFCRYSDDRGASWSPEQVVNTDPGNADQWNHALDSDENGVVAISWSDRRNAVTTGPDADPYAFDRYLRVSVDNGATWVDEVRVSGTSASPATPVSPFYEVSGCRFRGDYDTVAVFGDQVGVTWTDDRFQSQSQSTTPPFDIVTTPNPDVYFDSVPLVDSDNDGTLDIVDNCLDAPNGPNLGTNIQLDTDSDGFGNACDPDIDEPQDGQVLGEDIALLFQCFNHPTSYDPGNGQVCTHADFTGDGNILGDDVAIAFGLFNMPVGPSGLDCLGSGGPCP